MFLTSAASCVQSLVGPVATIIQTVADRPRGDAETVVAPKPADQRAGVEVVMTG